MRETSLPQKTEHNELNRATEALNLSLWKQSPEF